MEDLESGHLPPLCAKTGEPADGFAKVVSNSTPSWTWILLLFGILPFLIVHYFTTVRIVGLVPMSDVALRRGRAFIDLPRLLRSRRSRDRGRVLHARPPGDHP